jgi:hypothetical protein
VTVFDAGAIHADEAHKGGPGADECFAFGHEPVRRWLSGGVQADDHCRSRNRSGVSRVRDKSSMCGA